MGGGALVVPLLLRRRLVPLLPYLFGATSLALALAVGGLGLFVAGAIVSRFTNRRWWSGGLRQLLLGAPPRWQRT